MMIAILSAVQYVCLRAAFPGGHFGGGGGMVANIMMLS
jgi:hypothetical protein